MRVCTCVRGPGDFSSVCVHLCLRVQVCASVCVRARPCVCGCLPELVSLSMGTRVRAFLHSCRHAVSCARVCVERVCLCAHLAVVLALPWHGEDGSACGVRGSRVYVLRLVPAVGSPALAAGVTWTSRTTSAPWGGRNSHTSVVDAAGAIYVIGGWGNAGYYQDVWVSIDRGAWPNSVRGARGGSKAVVGDTKRYLGY